MSAHESMSIRRTLRHDVALRGRFSVAREHENHVRLSRVAGLRDGWMESDVVDLSGGGLGILTPIYLPKRLVLKAEILDPRGSGTLMTCTCRVTRVVMTDRRPMYLIGVLFEDMAPADRARLTELLAGIASTEDAA